MSVSFVASSSRAKIKEKVRRERAKEERAAKKKALQSSSDETESSPKVYQPVPLDFYNSPRTAVPPVEEDDENQQIIDLLTSPSKKTLTAADAAPFLASSPSSEDFDTPLAKRILRSVVFPSPEKSFKESPAAGGSSKATFTVDDTLDDVFDSDDAANNTTLLLSATPSRSTRVTRRSLAAHVSLNASRADSIRQHPTPIRPAASFAKVRPLSESAGSKKRKRVSDVEVSLCRLYANKYLRLVICQLDEFIRLLFAVNDTFSYRGMRLQLLLKRRRNGALCSLRKMSSPNLRLVPQTSPTRYRTFTIQGENQRSSILGPELLGTIAGL